MAAATAHARMYGIMPRPFPISIRNWSEHCATWNLFRSMDERGHVNFRGAIPDGPVDHSDYAAADGQLGRDHEGVSRLADFRRFRLARKNVSAGEAQPGLLHSHLGSGSSGGLFEPHHNTYDIEFWGAGRHVHQHLSWRSFGNGADGEAQPGTPPTRNSMGTWRKRCARFNG